MDRPGEWQPAKRCAKNKYLKDGKETVAESKEELLEEAVKACEGLTLLFPNGVQQLIA